VVAEARRALPRKICVLIDSGAHRAFAGHYFPVYEPNTLFSATGLGPMGWAVSAAIGVAVARPGTPVVVFTGDGCMLQQGMEIQTAARHRLPILYVVFDNQALGNVYLRQKKFGPGPAALCELPKHDWAGMARSFGLEGLALTHPADLAPAFADFSARPRPMLFDVACDRDALTPIEPWQQALSHPDIYAE
jgi:acetolactate synthase-1/2/3 large subunit